MHDPGVEYLAAEICYARFGVAIENITRAQADVIKQEARDRLAPVRTFLTPHQTEAQMTNQYRILDENGEEYASAGVVAACAKLQGVSPKFQAEFDAVRLNEEAGYRAFREQRVTGKDAM